jgi:molybdopterin-containing oxidoreductase family iron-sulfur binding subunit
MPPLKIWGQGELAGLPIPMAGEATRDRGWFRSLDEYRGDRGLGANVLEGDPIRPGEATPASLSRRTFLQLLGGGLGVTSLGACFKPPNGQILPYGRSIPNVVPGEPLHYATAYEIDGVATPLLVTCFDGRPTKVEGNPDHPENLGSTGVFEQALLEQLYDPTRLQTISEKGTVRSGDAFEAALRASLKKLEANRGAGLRLLVNPTGSPFLLQLRTKVLAQFPLAQIIEYRSVDFDPSAGTQLAFGTPATPRYDLTKADVVVALDADPLWTQPYGQRIPRELASRRTPEGTRPMNRLYAVEANYSLTGMMADHRVRARSAEIGHLALALLHRIAAQRSIAGLSAPAIDVGPHAKFIEAVASDLLRNVGKSLVLVGPRQPAEVQAIGHLLNLALGNIGTTERLELLPGPAAGVSSGTNALRALGKDIDEHRVEMLLVLADNPVFSAPPELALASRIGAVPISVYLGYYLDETARAARWTVPLAHPFESWGDARAADGSLVVCQPLLAPIFGGRSEAELLSLVLDEVKPVHDQLFEAWHKRVAPDAPAFSERWAELLRKGFHEPAPPSAPQASLGSRAQATVTKVAQSAPANGLSLGLYPSYQVHDGRFGRNGWLQELPDPITKATWTNVALVSPQTAAQLGLRTGALVELSLHGRSITLPAYVLPGHVDGEISVALGFGQRAALPNVAKPSYLPPDLINGTSSVTDQLAGVDAYPLRTLDAPWFASGLELRATGESKAVALTQEHWSMEGRELALQRPVTALSEGKDLAGSLHTEEHKPSFYAPVEYKGFRWAMAIDLARCSGCSACVVACQAENNIPIVGEDEVNRGREMHWIRLDRYFVGNDLANPGAITQPVACVHCEDAPCEYVCPVNATVHSDEGLNEMVYNHCVGTRYCSNNCPYHVRRFNFLNYSYHNKSATEQMVFNPEVTVRSRGVMEKCSYCVQRIERGRISARVEGRDIKDGDIKTACQSVCPTQAISFGTLSDPHSRVSELRRDPRAYQLLKDLGTRPRTSHLVRLKNENPELA